MSPANLNSNCVLPVPIGSSRNSNFDADVLETHSHWAFLPMIFVISIFELTKTARSVFKVLGVGSIGLLVSENETFPEKNKRKCDVSSESISGVWDWDKISKIQLRILGKRHILSLKFWGNAPSFLVDVYKF